MTYFEALAEARKGEKISRKGWGPMFGWHYVTRENNGPLIMNDPCNGYGDDLKYVRCWEYESTEVDTSACDWEVVDKIRKWR